MKKVKFKNLVSALLGLICLIVAPTNRARADVQSPLALEDYLPAESKELGGTLPMIWRLDDKEIQLRFSTDPASPSNIEQCPAWAFASVKGTGKITLSNTSYDVKSICYLFAYNTIWRYRLELKRNNRAPSAWIDCFSDFCWQ